jgi:arylsulfatase A
MKRIIAPALAMLVCLALAQTGRATERGGAKPNFIFVLVDDLGWTDLSCYGSTFYETPHIDRLAARGMRFTSAYAACTVCSPTRASILTGKYPARLHLTDWIPGHARPAAKLRVPDWTQHLPLGELTMAEALHEAGYATASIGKWHLGGEGYEPERQGFDVNVAGDHRGQPSSYFSPYKIPSIPDGKPGEYLTDRLTDEAIAFIARNRDRPFYLYLPHYGVHTPLQAKKPLMDKYAAKADPAHPQHNAVYAAMIESVDLSVGRLAHQLDELGIADRTVFVFMSDNGGLIGNPAGPVTSNLPLRAGKGSAYEGGVRVPMFVCWPGAVRPNSTCDVPVISVDFFPTMLEMAGLSAAPAHRTDGVSLVPLLQGKSAIEREAIYWHYPHYHPGGATPYGAVRQGDLKLIEFFEDDHVELYDVRRDIGEAADLVDRMPEETAALRARLHEWRRAVGAQMPVTNPASERN